MTSTARVAAIALVMVGAPAAGADLTGVLTVCNAGSQAAPVARVLADFAALHPGVKPAQESAGSLDIVRRATELGRPCDVLAVADYEVLPALVVPAYASWYAVFARKVPTFAVTVAVSLPAGAAVAEVCVSSAGPYWKPSGYGIP